MSLSACMAAGCLLSAALFLVVDAVTDRRRRHAPASRRPAGTPGFQVVEGPRSGGDSAPLMEAAAIVRQCIRDHPDLLAFANSLRPELPCGRCGGPVRAERCPRCQPAVPLREKGS